MPGGYNRDLQDCKPLYMEGLATTRTTIRIMAKLVDALAIDEERLRAGFTPGVFATDAALRMVAQGTPWREAYSRVRSNLEALETEDCDKAVAAKTHEGATAGLDWALYKTRISETVKSVNTRKKHFQAKLRSLLGDI